MCGPSAPTGLLAGGHISEDQRDVFAFLADRKTYNLAFPVVRIDTHTAVVFLAGADVYKVKRAIRFPFLDLSTPERRRRACEAEVAVNRRYAPNIYLGVVPVTREGGNLQIGGSGEPVEWAVHMKRFDESRTLDQIAERGELSAPLIRHLVEIVLETYRTAEIRDGDAATAALQAVVEETISSLADSGEVFVSGETAELAATTRAAFRQLTPLLLERGRRGRVWRCHGDLHLRNIALIDGVPTLFDAIEFDESIATIDVLYDLAFLLMDLWERGFRAQANLVLNRYLWGSPGLLGELEGLAALPLFMSLRASVRAKVEALRYLDIAHTENARREARGYFSTARALIAEKPPRLIAIGGLSGAGKSTVAALIAHEIGRAPGAVHLRSDIERKRMFGAPERSHLPEEAYSLATSERVFASLREQAATAIAAGQSVIVDAVHLRPGEREMIAAVAARLGSRFDGIWLDAPVGALTERVAVRSDDASDATAAIVARQAMEPTGLIAWKRIDGSASPEHVAAVVLDAIANGDRPSRGTQ